MLEIVIFLQLMGQLVDMEITNLCSQNLEIF